MICKTVSDIVPHKCNPIPVDIGNYVAIDNSLPSGLIWIKEPKKRGTKMLGKPAGCFTGGYYIFSFRGKQYRCHRVIYYLTTCQDPGDKQVDHHRDMSNIGTNLRPATNQQNNFNRRSDHNSSSKYKGVVWHKHRKKWQATIALNGKQKHLGRYLNELDAACAYNIAAPILFGQYARLNELPPEYNTNLFEHRDKVIKKAHELLASN